MVETTKDTNEAKKPAAAIHVAPAPHLSSGSTSRRMMIDVLIALVPVAAVSLWIFQWYALKQIIVCVAGCVVAEAVFTAMRRRPIALGDCSAVVTGLILAFSMPGTAPWWVGAIGSAVAIGLGKVVFGGIGQNIFNPAMVGRAFVMVAFTKFLGAGGYVDIHAAADAITQATPMTAAFKAGEGFDLLKLLTGQTNGSLGETSAIACLLGGLYLCIRRTASWQIPAGAILGLLAAAGIDNLAHPAASWTALHHLFGGAFMLGAFFICTDPVTSPLTSKGKFIFGLIFGLLVMLIRLFTNYPEGVMFSVLLVNAITPLLNRWTVRKPLGWVAEARK
ncbi:MAG: RnfABCDGE type electron transport complex subunit D [Planctomycetota bacterium]|nr:RnfABCDGE type electron transport complex subunit D [Planctomycetota bacterium]